MDLSKYEFPKVTKADIAFPTFNVTKKLLKEAESRDLSKGRKKFNELFYAGGEIKLKKDVKGTWKENAFLYCKVLMNSWAPKHEHKESVCAMSLEETVEI